MESDLLRSVRKIRDARTFDALTAIIEAALIPYDLTDFMVSLVQQPGVDSSECIPLFNIDPDFVRWYLANDNFLVDPRVAISKRRLEAFLWSEAMDMDKLPTQARRIYARFAEAGLPDALNVSVRSINGLEGTVLFGGQHIELDARQRGNLTVLGIALHEQTKAIMLDSSALGVKMPLSAHVRQVLRYGAMGLTSDQIGKRMGLSKRTVDMHFIDAARILGSASRIQAVSKAYRLNLFSMDS